LSIDAHARRIIERTHLLLQPIADRQTQDIFGSPFDHEQPGRAIVEEHRNPAALEVELHFIDLTPAAYVDFRMLQDGAIQGTFQSRFKKTVEVGQLQNPRTFPAKGVQVAFQVDAGLGQGAGLVGTEYIHAPQIVDRGEPLDDHLAGCHAQRAPRQGHGDHHGEQFRRQLDGQGHGKQE
jgi:hypothetical protein